MQATRVIFKGKFDFGSPETVGRIARMLEPRILNLYKSDFPWKLEDILPEGSEQLVIKSESLHLGPDVEARDRRSGIPGPIRPLWRGHGLQAGRIGQGCYRSQAE